MEPHQVAKIIEAKVTLTITNEVYGIKDLEELVELFNSIHGKQCTVTIEAVSEHESSY